MILNFNMGQDKEMEDIIQKCKNYLQCEGCPIMEQGAIINPITRIKYSCSTAMIKNIQKNGKV